MDFCDLEDSSFIWVLVIWIHLDSSLPGPGTRPGDQSLGLGGRDPEEPRGIRGISNLTEEFSNEAEELKES